MTYVRNITDVDDKRLERAAERKIPFTELTAEMIGAMHKDEKRLGCQAPDLEPRATSNIDSMVGLISKLIEKNAAYQGSSGDVYCVSAFPSYGKLNNRQPEDMMEGARLRLLRTRKIQRILCYGSQPSLAKSLGTLSSVRGVQAGILSALR